MWLYKILTVQDRVGHAVVKELDPGESPKSRRGLDSPKKGSLTSEHHDFAGCVQREHLAGRLTRSEKSISGCLQYLFLKVLGKCCGEPGYDIPVSTGSWKQIKLQNSVPEG